LIQDVNTTTGVCTIGSGYDKMTGINGTGFLSDGMQVCFSPETSETQTIGGAPVTVTQTDATRAGYCAIDVQGVGVYQHFKSVYITGFHCAVRQGLSLASRYEDVQVFACNFAGYAQGFVGRGSDDVLDSFFVSGVYGANWTDGTTRQADSAYTIDEQGYRRMLAPFYIMGGGLRLGHIEAYDSMYNIFFQNAQHVMCDSLTLDRSYEHAIFSIDSIVNIDKVFFQGSGQRANNTYHNLVNLGGVFSIGIFDSVLSGTKALAAVNNVSTTSAVTRVTWVPSTSGYTTFDKIGADASTVLQP